MIGYRISLSIPVIYDYTGKFQAPSQQWKHEKIPLTDYELIVMTKGSLYLSYDNINYTVNEKEYLLLSPKHPICNRIGFKASYCSFYWLHFKIISSPVLINLTEACENIKGQDETIILPESGKLQCPDKIFVLMKQLQNFVRSDYGELSANYMTSTILCELFNQSFKEKLDNMRNNFSKKQIYYDMVDYINMNLYRNLKVADIASHFGYNKKYLSHIFVKITGTSLKQFVLQKKMDEANFLLTDTNKTVCEIAGLLGFSDNHNFMKNYKRITGLTPTEYRNAYSKRMLFHV